MNSNQHSIYQERQLTLQSAMQAGGVDGFFVSHNVDLLYYNGSMQTGFLFVPAEGESVFFVRRSVSRAIQESFARVEEMGSLRTLRERLAAFGGARFAQGTAPVIATEFDVIPVAVFERWRSALADVRWVDGSAIVRKQRSVKSQDEISHIREAASVVDAALHAVLPTIKPGITEIELVSALEFEMRRKGHLGIMRVRSYNSELMTGCLAAGEAVAEPSYFDGPAGGRGLSIASPQGASSRPIGIGEPIIVDIGCSIHGYLIDQTRTAVFGELPENLQRAYDVSEFILRETETKLKPGANPEQIYLNSVRLAEEAGLGEHFMGYGPDAVKFLGHGIGLEIDELPVLARGFTDGIQVNQVIAVEPKFTFPGVGVVGIENTYLITEDGFDVLTTTPEGVWKLPVK